MTSANRYPRVTLSISADLKQAAKDAKLPLSRMLRDAIVAKLDEPRRLREEMLSQWREISASSISAPLAPTGRAGSRKADTRHKTLKSVRDSR